MGDKGKTTSEGQSKGQSLAEKRDTAFSKISAAGKVPGNMPLASTADPTNPSSGGSSSSSATREDFLFEKIAGLDATMQHVCCFLSSLSGGTGPYSGDSSQPLTSPQSTLTGEVNCLPSVGQVHPATVPSFSPVARTFPGVSLPAQSVLP